MKLKLVVASMSMLGLISCPVLAAQAHHKHHVVKKQTVADYKDYKDFKDMVPRCPMVDQFTMMLDGLNQNIGRAKPTEGCEKAISFAGGIAFDAKWGNRSMGYMTENNQRLSLNDAYLNIYGNVNDWTKAFASISYSSVSNENANNFKSGKYSNVYLTSVAPVAAGTSGSTTILSGLTLEQGIIRVANFDEMPVYIELGKQFQPFGRYRIHPMTRSLVQSLTETLRTSAEVGFLTRMGLHGAVYAFDTPMAERQGAVLTNRILGHNKTDYGIEIGFDNFNDQLGYSVGFGYLNNLIGVNDIAYAVSTFNGSNGYNNRVGGGVVYGDLNSGPFTVSIRYMSAFNAFSPYDLQNRTAAIAPIGTASGAKPWAAEAQIGYNFNAWTRNQNVYIGYQGSGNTINIFLPQNRWLVGYNVDVWKNTMLAAEWVHDNDFSSSRGGTGRTSNQLTVRAAVQFG